MCVIVASGCVIDGFRSHKQRQFAYLQAKRTFCRPSSFKLAASQHDVQPSSACLLHVPLCQIEEAFSSINASEAEEAGDIRRRKNSSGVQGSGTWNRGSVMGRPIDRSLRYDDESGPARDCSSRSDVAGIVLFEVSRSFQSPDRG
jgi:hypothetical protein